MISDFNKLPETFPFTFGKDNDIIDPVELATDLVKNMRDNNLLGLSANRLGYNYRVIALTHDPNIVCFNPRIVQLSEETIELEEASSMFPGLFIKISRPKHLRVRYQQPNEETITKQFTGLTAREIQHQIDVLDRKPFYDNASWSERARILKKWKIWKRRSKNGTNERLRNSLLDTSRNSTSLDTFTYSSPVT